MKFFLSLILFTALFADEYEYAIPFEFEAHYTDSEEQSNIQVVGAFLHLKNGELLFAGNFKEEGFFLENPFNKVEIATGEYSLKSVFDDREIAGALLLTTITEERILRKVEAVKENGILFDDGYFMKKPVEFSQTQLSSDSEEGSYNVTVDSLEPLFLKGTFTSPEAAISFTLSCKEGVVAELQINGDNSENFKIFLKFQSGDDLKTALGLGKFEVGESYYFYPVTAIKELLSELPNFEGALDEDLFLIYRK